MLKLKTNKKSGITLISLVVTIIVLLILAGISIMMLTGNNGILSKANDAKEQTIIGQEKESVELAYITAAMKKLGDNVTSEELQHELDLSVGANKTQVAGQDILQVYFTETEHSYEVENGTATRTEIFDANDGFYIAGQKASLKIYVPKKDAIISDIALKGYNEHSSINYNLCDLSMTNSEYLDVLKDLNCIDDNMKSFIKTKFLNTVTDSSGMLINGAPMFTIKKVDHKYFLVMEWDYYLGEDYDNTVFKSKVRISSEITFTNNVTDVNLVSLANSISSAGSMDETENLLRNFVNIFNGNDYTQYTLGDLKVEENAYECNTSSAPFDNNIPKKNSIITDLSITYNNKNYVGKDGLKDFLDNIVGFNNKDIIRTYILMSEDSTGEPYSEISGYANYFEIPLKIAEQKKVQNAEIITKYLEKSNELDGLYVKGQRITTKLQHDQFDKDEYIYLEQYIAKLFQLSQHGIMDVEYFKVLLDKQVINPLYISTAVNAIQHGISPRIKNVQIPAPMIEENNTNYFNLDFYDTCNITMSQAVLGEIHDYGWRLDFELELYLDPQTGDIEFDNLSFNPYLLSVTFYHSYPDEANFEWDDFREKGLVPYLNENILPFPDKEKFWNIAQDHSSDEDVNSALSAYNKNKTKRNEIDLYVYVYRSIIKEAINSGKYVIKNDGKTYTGTKAFENFLREEYGLNNLNKIREWEW